MEPDRVVDVQGFVPPKEENESCARNLDENVDFEQAMVMLVIIPSSVILRARNGIFAYYLRCK